MSRRNEEELKELLRRMNAGDAEAREEFHLQALSRMRAIARARTGGRNAPGASTVVHEAFLRLPALLWSDAEHFFSVFARVARRVVIDRARWVRAARRDVGRETGLDSRIPARFALSPESELTLHAALDELEAAHRNAARVVRLHFFAGMTFHEVGLTLQISATRAKNDWAFARDWLLRRLSS